MNDNINIDDLKTNIGKNRNPWQYRDRIITSLDFAKQEEILAALSRTTWDLIIFDEAHKLSWMVLRKNPIVIFPVEQITMNTEPHLMVNRTQIRLRPYFGGRLIQVEPGYFHGIYGGMSHRSRLKREAQQWKDGEASFRCSYN